MEPLATSTPTTRQSIQLPTWVNQLESSGMTKLSEEQQRRIEAAKAYAAAISQQIQNSQQSTLERPKSPPIPIHPPVRSMSTSDLQTHHRIYIGAINYEITEPQLRMAFSTFGHVKSVSLSLDPATLLHKGYCFLDYETVEGACMAIDKMNGKMFGGRPIKVGRPQGYNTDILKQMAHPKSRIYVANIHEIITEDDLKDLFSGFGRVKAVAMPPDLTTKKHKGYAFVEFERQSAAQNALSCMDEFLLGDRHIKISPGIINNPMPEGMSLLPRNNVKIPSDIRNIANAINKTLGISDSAAERGVLVVLRNMISADEINDPELEQELCQELEKFGIVRSLDFSVQPADNKADVLVYFDTEESASEARQSLNGRYFGGNQIEAV